MQKFALVLFACVWTASGVAQGIDIDPPKIVRSYTLAGVDPQIARAELVRFGATTTVAQLVDIVAEFVPTYGQANNIRPLELGPKGLNSVLYQFKGHKAIAGMVRAGEGDDLAGPHGCRIFMDPSKGKPKPEEFARIVHWCANTIVVGNIDPSALASNAR